jgi:hypothetical protein
MDQFETENNEPRPDISSQRNTLARADSTMLHVQPTTNIDVSERLTQLEIENSRLQQLVAELLIKNYQLRNRSVSTQ